jgi:hypothetical protein
LPFLFAAADLPNGGICFGWVDVDPVVVFDDGIDFWAPVAVVIVVVADWSGPTAPCVPLPTAACLPRFPLLPR